MPCSVSSAPDCEGLGSNSRAWTTEPDSPPGCSHHKAVMLTPHLPLEHFPFLPHELRDNTSGVFWLWSHVDRKKPDRTLWCCSKFIGDLPKQQQRPCRNNNFSNRYPKLAGGKKQSTSFILFLSNDFFWQNWIKKISLSAFFFFFNSDLRKTYGRNFHMMSTIIKRDYKMWAGHIPEENEPWNWESDRTAFLNYIPPVKAWNSCLPFFELIIST